MPSTLCAAVDQYHREGFLLRPGFIAREVALLKRLIDSERERLQALAGKCRYAGLGAIPIGLVLMICLQTRVGARNQSRGVSRAW